jgi:5-(carboxyamino)imidazole ribonucleotide synthase
MRKVGILGGGQLGRMLLQAAANYPVETYVMEATTDCPSAHLCHHFVTGDFRNFDDVYRFGKGLDAITIEIESVNEEALFQLQKEGVNVYPSPSALKIIKNKILQKQFYQENEIPTSAFLVTQQVSDLQQNENLFPGVHKLASGGYDGRGVTVLEKISDSHKGFNEPAVFEKKVEIEKEISVIIACSNDRQTAIYEPVHMIFSKDLNQLDYQISPAILEEQQLWRAEAIALKVVKKLNSPGIFAVEMFIDSDGNIWVNETAPRVHNSGHHTIEGCYSSQFDMLWRIMLAYPLGNTEPILPAAMINLVGEEGHSGAAVYHGLTDLLEMDNLFVHIYGKKETRPGRKMGHVTILSAERQELIHRSGIVKRTLKVISAQQP